MNEIVVSNEFNDVVFKEFKQVDFDLFVAACVATRKKESTDIHISGKTMRQLLRVPTYNKPAFKKALLDGVRTIRAAYYENTEKGIDTFNIFERFYYTEDSDDLHIKFTDSGHELIMKQDYFLIASLAEYNAFTSFYVKRLYLLLKQHRIQQKDHRVFPKAGLWIEWERFCDLLQIPKSYSVNDINRRILQNAKTQFEKVGVFKNLKYKKEYSADQGRRTTAITITFEPESQSTWKDDPAEIEHMDIPELKPDKSPQQVSKVEQQIATKQAKVDDLTEGIRRLRDDVIPKTRMAKKLKKFRAELDDKIALRKTIIDEIKELGKKE